MEVTSILASYELFLETLKGLPINEIDSIIRVNKELYALSRRETFWGDLIRLSYGLTRSRPSNRDDYIIMQAIFSTHHLDPEISKIIEELRQEEIRAWLDGKNFKYFVTDDYVNCARDELVPSHVYRARTPHGAVLKEHNLVSTFSMFDALVDRVKQGEDPSSPQDLMEEVDLPTVV